MPRKAQGTTFVSDGTLYARVVIAPKKYTARGLQWLAVDNTSVNGPLLDSPEDAFVSGSSMSISIAPERRSTLPMAMGGRQPCR
jgi:hypothetical protein